MKATHKTGLGLFSSRKFIVFLGMILLLLFLTQVKVPMAMTAELLPLPEKYKDYVSIDDINGIPQGVFYDDGHGDIEQLPVEYKVMQMPNMEGIVLRASGIDVAGCASTYTHKFEVEVTIANNLPEPTKATLKVVVSDVNEKVTYETKLLPIELIPREKATVDLKFSISAIASDIAYYIRVYIPTSEDLGSNPNAVKYISLLESLFINLGILRS